MKTIGTIIAIVLLIVVGFLIFNGNDGDLAGNGDNATTTENLTGTGGPEEGFDPLDMENFENESFDGSDTGDEMVPDKG